MDEEDLEGKFWRANGTKEAEAIKMMRNQQTFCCCVLSLDQSRI